ncbi:anaerobic sulfatase maturase, partial [Parabacteroides distasonis]|nr:anaerobic sulfatase maturase [Parabacteroides distasonis]
CKYCFYHSIAENRTTGSYGIMSIDTLETVVKKAFEYAEQVCTFAFQGGEPTLAGLDFFKKAIDFVKLYNKKNIKVNFALQTNGIVIDEEWYEFLAENNFLVGISLDGPKDIHNSHRIDSKNDGTFNKVMKTIELFNKFKVEYNILYVVTAQSSRYANKIYDFFKKNNFRYIQFISCLDPLNEDKGNYPYSLKPEALEKFLKITFDRWYEDFMKGDYVSVRYFDNIITMILGNRPEACSMVGKCHCQCVVEADGGVYPCDFYVIDEWKLGNIKDNDIQNMINCETAKNFVKASVPIADECKECKWYPLCRGACRRERDTFGEEGIGLNYYCSAYKAFFDYAYTRMLDVARLI